MPKIVIASLIVQAIILIVIFEDAWRERHTSEHGPITATISNLFALLSAALIFWGMGWMLSLFGWAMAWCGKFILEPIAYLFGHTLF